MVSLQKIWDGCFYQHQQRYFLVQLPQLELLEYFCCREDAGVDDARHGERSSDDGADGGQEMVQRRPAFVIPNSYRVQVIPVKIFLNGNLMHS